jgi:hypothetical protein
VPTAWTLSGLELTQIVGSMHSMSGECHIVQHIVARLAGTMKHAPSSLPSLALEVKRAVQRGAPSTKLHDGYTITPRQFYAAVHGMRRLDFSSHETQALLLELLSRVEWRTRTAVAAVQASGIISGTSKNINDGEDEGDIRGEEGAKALALVRRKFREAADSAATVALSIDRASAQAGWPLLVGFFLLHDQLAAIQTLPVSTMV